MPGYLVLASRAGVAEARLPWVGLTDLLRSAAAAAVLPALPSPQRQALQVVMLQSESGEVADERAVGTALWSVLGCAWRSPARCWSPWTTCPTWTRRARARCGSRCGGSSRRAGCGCWPPRAATDPQWPPWTGCPATGCCRSRVGPVTVGALFELLAARLEARLARPVLLRVHATSGGNPLYALELARALARLEIVPRPGVPLPVPTSLDGLVAERVASAPPEILQIAAGTAASWRFTDAGLDPGEVERAVLRRPRRRRRAAGCSGMPRIVRAAHPLVSAAAYAALPAAARRALHQRLAAGADDPLERARHAALAAVEHGSPGRHGARRRRGGRAGRQARPTSRWNCRGWPCSTPRPTPTAPCGLTCWPTRWSGRATARERWRPSGRRSR